MEGELVLGKLCHSKYDKNLAYSRRIRLLDVEDALKRMKNGKEI